MLTHAEAPALVRDIQHALQYFLAPAVVSTSAMCVFSDIPLDLLDVVCSFLFVHEHVRLMSCSPRLLQLCSRPRTWHTIAFDEDHFLPEHLHWSSEGSLDRIVTAGSEVSRIPRPWSEVRHLTWPARAGRFDLKELWAMRSLSYLDLQERERLEDLTPISACRGLTFLNLCGTQVANIFPLCAHGTAEAVA